MPNPESPDLLTQGDPAVDDAVNFRTRKWVKPEDLNANGSLFGGSLLRWIDEEAAIYAIIQLGNYSVVTKFISEIEFQASAKQGDLIEMGLRATHFGRTSLTKDDPHDREDGLRQPRRRRPTGAARLRLDHLSPRSDAHAEPGDGRRHRRTRMTPSGERRSRISS